jgi:hypothetical protein
MINKYRYYRKLRIKTDTPPARGGLGHGATDHSDGGPLKRLNRGWVKNICPEVQTSNHGNPPRREPQVIRALIKAAECLMNEPFTLRKMISG